MLTTNYEEQKPLNRISHEILQRYLSEVELGIKIGWSYADAKANALQEIRNKYQITGELNRHELGRIAGAMKGLLFKLKSQKITPRAIEEKYKKCNWCGLVKPITEFHFKDKHLGTRKYQCKECVSEYNKKKRELSKKTQTVSGALPQQEKAISEITNRPTANGMRFVVNLGKCVFYSHNGGWKVEFDGVEITESDFQDIVNIFQELLPKFK